LKKVIEKLIIGRSIISENNFAVHSGKVLNIKRDSQLAINNHIKLP
jgi:hypothetical protein